MRKDPEELRIGDFGLTAQTGNPKSMIQMLSRFDDLAGLQTASADANALRTAAHKRADGLKIRIEPAVRPVVSVADGVTKLWSLAADFAAFCHCSTPPLRLLR
jgi:hypothetical protein